MTVLSISSNLLNTAESEKQNGCKSIGCLPCAVWELGLARLLSITQE